MSLKDYEIIKEESTDFADFAICILTGGLYGLLGGCNSPTTYTIKYKDGTIEKIIAKNKEELHKKISNKH